MPLVVVGISVLVLLVLMTRLKLNGFAALLLVAVGVALVQGIAMEKIPDVLAEGIGGQIGDTMLTIGLGAMVGRVLGDSGAAQRMRRLLEVCGPRWVQVAMVLTAMLIGVTMFYEVAFVIIVPIAFTLVRVTRANLLWVGLPMSIALSTMHSFLPPHPGPTAVAATFHASVGLTLFYGLFIAVPVGAFIALLTPTGSGRRDGNGSPSSRRASPAVRSPYRTHPDWASTWTWTGSSRRTSSTRTRRSPAGMTPWACGTWSRAGPSTPNGPVSCAETLRTPVRGRRRGGRCRAGTAPASPRPAPGSRGAPGPD
ncbi:hypothetical protein SCHAM137S_03091 [Streptomyces chartreusis]